MATITEIKILTSVDLGFAVVSLREDQIIHTDIKIKNSLTLEHAQQILDAYLKVGNGKKMPNLFTPSKFVIPDNDVLVFLREVANKKGKADAFVIQSLPQKLIGNFYLKFHKPVLPTKLFTSKEKAIEWLKTF